MTISVAWANKVINVPKVDTTLVDIGPPEIRTINVNTLRLALKALEAAEEGMPFDDTNQHNTQITLGGITYARLVEFINSYTITFEAGAYGIDLSDANNNIMDVLNLNSTQLRSNNSAGLQVVTSGSGVTEQDKLDIADRVWEETTVGHLASGTFGELVQGTLGLVGQNVQWTNLSHDANNNMTAATISQYATSSLVVKEREWTVVATYNSNSEVVSYQLVRVL